MSNKLVKIGAAILAPIIIGACIAATGFGFIELKGTANQIADADKEIASIQEEISTLQGGVEEKDDPISEADKEVETGAPEVRLYSADVEGNAVAELQTAYNDTLTDEQKLVSNAEKLKPYFEEDKTEEIVPWYYPDEGEVCAWRYATPGEHPTPTFDVMWYCEDESGKILAFTTASFDATKGIFYNVSYRRTGEGGNGTSSEYPEPDDYVFTDDEEVEGYPAPDNYVGP